MSEFDKYIEENHKVDDIDPQGEAVLKTSHDTHDFDYEFDESTKSYEDALEDDITDDFDFDDLPSGTYHEHNKKREQYDKHYDSLFSTYTRHDNKSKKSITKEKSNTFSEDQIAGFEHVKNYYIANMEEKQRASHKKSKIVSLLGIAFFISFTVLFGTIFYDMGKGIAQHSVYVTQTEAIQANEVSELRKRIEAKTQIDNATTMNKQEIKPIIKSEQPIIPPTPSVVNNYNFEQLNSGLATLGYSLLACFAFFISFRGLSAITKSFKLKREIKKSKQLIHSFNLAISKQDNQLAISQLINDQIVINNILIERLNKNNNVIELMAVNEKMKDTSQFINNNLINNLKEV